MLSLQAKITATLSKAYFARTGLYEISNVCDQDSQSFLLTPKQLPVMQARCDMETDGGGWMVILRRKSDASPPVNFNRTWTEYENGFGDLNTEFWYGLRNIHCLTTRDTMQLQVQLNYSNGTGLTWTYHHFRVHGAENDYRLHIGRAEGPSGFHDALRYHNGRSFSTFDSDNDDHNSLSCAIYGGGWWFGACYHSFLTGKHTSRKFNENIYWGDGSEATASHYCPHVEMKIRHKSCPRPQKNEC